MRSILVKGDDKEFKEIVVGGLLLKYKQTLTPAEIQVVDVNFGDYIYKRDFPGDLKMLIINYSYPEGAKRHGSVPHIYGDIPVDKTLDVGTEHK